MIKSLREKIVDSLFERSESPYVQALKRPEIYFNKLLRGTFLMGIVTFLINLAYVYTDLHTYRLSSGVHTLVGFVIAMLLVFRTNTSYDRWWEGRKKMQELNTHVSFFVASLKSSRNMDERIQSNLICFIERIRDYLKLDRKKDNTYGFHQTQMEEISSILGELKELSLSGRISNAEYSQLRSTTKEMLETMIAMERIKNTPIPLAYSIHVKSSSILYIITLPFSVFYEMGLWSTLIVMFIYFMVLGVEIISAEIENPFSGEPNDLPVDNLIEGILRHVK